MDQLSKAWVSSSAFAYNQVWFSLILSPFLFKNSGGQGAPPPSVGSLSFGPIHPPMPIVFGAITAMSALGGLLLMHMLFMVDLIRSEASCVTKASSDCVD